MSIYLVKKQWGYQTVCPDEENTTGYYRPENKSTIQFYNRPSFNSKIFNKCNVPPNYYDSVWGWKEKTDHKNKITWVKVSNYSDIWAPFDSYEGRIVTCSLCKKEGHNKRTCNNKPV